MIITGLMEGLILVNGKIIICMGKALILGKTVENMMVNTNLIRSTDSEFITGLMEENMRVIGKTENSKF